MTIVEFERLGEYSRLPSMLENTGSYRKKRSRSDLLREFELESWGALLEKFLQNEYKTYSDFMLEMYPNSGDQAYFDGNEFRLATPNQVQQLLQNSITEIIKSYLQSNKKVLELGAGFGAQLINLHKSLNDPDLSLNCSELTNSGRLLADEISKKYHLNLASNFVDLENPVTLDLDSVKSGLVFTSFSLMYLKNNVNDIIQKILSGQPETLILFEPLYEDYDLSTVWGKQCAEWLVINDYSLDIKSQAMHALSYSQSYHLISHQPLHFGSNPFLPYSVLVIGKK